MARGGGGGRGPIATRYERAILRARARVRRPHSVPRTTSPVSHHGIASRPLYRITSPGSRPILVATGARAVPLVSNRPPPEPGRTPRRSGCGGGRPGTPRRRGGRRAPPGGPAEAPPRRAEGAAPGRPWERRLRRAAVTGRRPGQEADGDPPFHVERDRSIATGEVAAQVPGGGTK